MAQLSEAHIEQIKVLLREGKKAREIVNIMDKTYPGVNFVASQVYYVKKHMDEADAIGAGPKVKRHYKKRKENKINPERPDRAVMEILTIVAEIHEGYKKVFSFLRSELLKSRDEVRLMLTGAGIEAPESEIE